MAIHAGLECGILSPHSPDERANIPSVAKCWEFLQAVLANIPVKQADNRVQWSKMPTTKHVDVEQRTYK